jgi:pilus assembly protein CpaB
MGRRTVLLLVAALIAAVGTSMVFLYVRGVDARAAEQYDAVQVLKAVELIESGETLADAQAAGKIAMGTVGRGQLLDGALTTIGHLRDKVALTSIYPGEQVISSKFGEAGAQDGGLSIPEGKMAISVELSDPARVAGFVNPGAEVAVFISAEPELKTPDGETTELPKFTRLLLPRVRVIGVGTTTMVSTVTTDESGGQTTEELPRTLLTLAVDQAEAEKIIFAANNGELAFALLTEDSSVEKSPGVTATDMFG